MEEGGRERDMKGIGGDGGGQWLGDRAAVGSGWGSESALQSAAISCKSISERLVDSGTPLHRGTASPTPSALFPIWDLLSASSEPIPSF